MVVVSCSYLVSCNFFYSMEFSQIIKKIHTLISESSNILLISHRNPDGDTLGAGLALAHFLKGLDKNFAVFCRDPLPTFLSFLSGFDGIEIGKAPELSSFDLVIALDCSDLEQTGLVKELGEYPKKRIINIDHHLTNTNYGQHNLVFPDCVSTTVVLYQVFDKLKINIDKVTATCLLTGILTDTGNLSSPSTGNEALKIASRLVAKGAQVRQINHCIIKNKSLAILKLWSRVFLRIKKAEDLDLAWTFITKGDIKECGVDELATEGISNFFNFITDSSVFLVLREVEAGMIKGSLRTTKNFIDVSKFAKIMGGGGHRWAAGFRLKGDLASNRGGDWKIV